MFIIFILKHFVADFVLQTNWIARVKVRENGWQVAMLVHCFEHAILTYLILLFITKSDIAFVIACCELVLHFIIDKTKVELNRSVEPYGRKFWLLMGADQTMHLICLYYLVTLAINLGGRI